MRYSIQLDWDLNKLHADSHIMIDADSEDEACKRVSRGLEAMLIYDVPFTDNDTTIFEVKLTGASVISSCKTLMNIHTGEVQTESAWDTEVSRKVHFFEDAPTAGDLVEVCTDGKGHWLDNDGHLVYQDGFGPM